MEKETNLKQVWHKDLLAVQSAIPSIPYNQTVNFGKVKFSYADLQSIHKVVKPILAKNNFILLYGLESKEGFIHLNCEIIHKSDECFSNTISFAPSPDPKQTGSLITYYKRYLLCALLAIDAEEDVDVAPQKEVIKKVAITAKAFNALQERIANGEKGLYDKCLERCILTEEQNKVLLNLELEHQKAIENG
jgi:hypothetical protein